MHTRTQHVIHTFFIKRLILELLLNLHGILRITWWLWWSVQVRFCNSQLFLPEMCRTFAGKKFKPSARQNIFFSWEIEFVTYINLYSFESWMKWPFEDIFFGSRKISNYAKRAESTLCKYFFTNPDFEAINHFRVNSYPTLAVLQSIPYQSSFMVSKFQRNQRKPESIKIFLSSRHCLTQQR